MNVFNLMSLAATLRSLVAEHKLEISNLRTKSNIVGHTLREYTGYKYGKITELSRHMQSRGCHQYTEEYSMIQGARAEIWKNAGIMIAVVQGRRG